MKTILAKTAGFCFGVERAVKMAFEIDEPNNTYTLGPIIHNDSVVDKLKAKNIYPIDSLEGHIVESLIIRSHGVAKSVYQDASKKEINIIDATCPYVKKIHKLVNRYSSNDYKIIVIGNKQHPEIIGIEGWASGVCTIIKDEKDSILKQLDKKNKYFVVAQTTYKKQVVDNILEVLNNQQINYEFTNTICNATKERQEEAVEIAREVDVMIVIGSYYSSNTQKLYEICKQECKDTYCIAEYKELTRQMFINCNTVGVTAGASTPNDVIEAVLQKINQLSED